MQFWLSKDEKTFSFRSYFVLKDEAKKIINKQHWIVTVKATQNEIYVNNYMFPKNRQETSLSNGYVLLKFALTEVDLC